MTPHNILISKLIKNGAKKGESLPSFVKKNFGIEFSFKPDAFSYNGKSLMIVEVIHTNPLSSQKNEAYYQLWYELQKLDCELQLFQSNEHGSGCQVKFIIQLEKFSKSIDLEEKKFCGESILPTAPSLVSTRKGRVPDEGIYKLRSLDARIECRNGEVTVLKGSSIRNHTTSCFNDPARKAERRVRDHMLNSQKVRGWIVVDDYKSCGGLNATVAAILGNHVNYKEAAYKEI